MNWEIVTFGSGSQIQMVLNGVAMLFGNDNYLTAMATTAMIAFVGWLVVAAFDAKGLGTFRSLMAMLFFYMIVIVPKTDVIITDRVIPANSAVVSNVPLGLAMTAGFFSKMGDFLARSYETVMGTPSTISYTGNGVLFAHSMIESAGSMRLTDAALIESIDGFMKNCVFLDGLGHGRFTADELKNSNNLDQFFGERVAQNAAHFKFVTSSGGSTIEACRSGWVNQIRPQLVAVTDQIIARSAATNHQFFGRFGDPNDATVAMRDGIQTSLTFMTGVGITGEQAARQMALINALGSGWEALANDLEYGTMMQSLVLEKAERERKLTYSTMARLSDEMLPMLFGIFQAFLYGIFPVIVLLAFFSPAKVSMGYVKGLVWINLWPVIYAIIHTTSTYYDQNIMTAQMGQFGGGFNTVSNTVLMEKLADTRNTAAYLASSIPLIAWMLIATSGAMAASFAGRVLQGYDSSVSSAASEAAAGEMKVGGIDYKTTNDGLAPQSVNQTSMNSAGVQQLQTAGGENYYNAPQSNTALSAADVTTLTSTAQQSAESATAFQETSERALGLKTAATLGDLNALQSQIQDTAASGAGFETNNSAEMVAQSTATQQLDEALAREAGVSTEEASNWRMGIGGSAGFGGSAKGFSAAVSGSAGVDGSVRNATTEAERSLDKAAKSQAVQDAMKAAVKATQTTASTFNISDSDTAVAALQASSSETQEASEQYRQAVSQTETARELVQNTQAFAQQFSMNTQDQLLNGMAEANGTSKGEVVATVTAAARGDEGAIDRLNGMMGAFLAKAESNQDPVPAVDVDARYAQMGEFASENRERVNAAGDRNSGTVQRQQDERGLTSERADAITTGRLANQQNAFQDPNVLQVQDNAVRDQIRNEGRELEADMDKRREEIGGNIESGNNFVSTLNRTTLGDVGNAIKKWFK